MRVYAHTIPGQPESQWEPIGDHLARVAYGGDLEHMPGAAGFAGAFGASACGELLGQWHDLGKYAPGFQRYLRESALHPDNGVPTRRHWVEHKSAGTVQVSQQLHESYRFLAYCILGHHGGLPNAEPEGGEPDESTLNHRLAHPTSAAKEALKRAPAELLGRRDPTLPHFKKANGCRVGQAIQLAFLTRMLFSALVDADYLATEAFVDPDRAAARRRPNVSIAELATHLRLHLESLSAHAQRTAPESSVNHQRSAVLDACRAAARQPPGLFTLTVPTGGGKTLSSLAFALDHAEAHGLRRVITAIPFTSIIEQNARVFRRALGDTPILEHHSNMQPRKQDRNQDQDQDNPTAERDKLSTENWDAPVIVTTNVQLLESLFASQTSRCRKLHRLANSVIVLDEAQALPVNLLAPTLAALGELVLNYGCTLVLCTATQPALTRSDAFPIGLPAPTPIIPDDQRATLFHDLRRVRVETGRSLDDDQLADELANHDQLLCIVNTRDHAAELFQSLAARFGESELHGDNTCWHLSANMFPRHRAAVLRAIRRRLDAGLPCRVISTQLVEAGVDVDFPVVYRAMAGLDSIAQAAGRCNREGRLPHPGRVVVFDPADRRTPAFARAAIQDARQVLETHGDDPLAPEAQHAYFHKHYLTRGGPHGRGWDRPPNTDQHNAGVLDCFTLDHRGPLFQFRTAAARYRLIPDAQWPIIIPRGSHGRALADRLTTADAPPTADLLRQLQRYAVSVREPAVDAMLDQRILHPTDETHDRFVLQNPDAYDRRLGLRPEGVDGMEPERLICDEQ